MSNFTKGDWVLRGENIGIEDDSDTQAYGMLLTIATIDKYDLESDYRANANLIKAAPAMYKALENFVNNKMVRERQPLGHRMAEKALAKARGESPEIPLFKGTREALSKLSIGGDE